MKTVKINVVIGTRWWINPVCTVVGLMFRFGVFPPSKISTFAAFIARHGTTTKVVAE